MVQRLLNRRTAALIKYEEPPYGSEM